MDATELRVRILSVQVGQPAAHRDEQGVWRTGFFKQPVSGSVRAHADHLEGDGQEDRRHHGGPDKAVLAYVADHFASWQQTLGIGPIPYGGFGENLSLGGIDETQVCLGDLWAVGELLVQVSQPRQPCWKLGRRWACKELLKQVIQTGRSGWYLRVVHPGKVAAGMTMELTERPQPDWSITKCNQVFYGGSPDAKRRFAALPELSTAWKQSLSSES